MSSKLAGSNNTHGVKMGRQTIKEMVVAYRENRPNQKRFNYAHFGAEEIIKLFVDNGIISNVEFNEGNFGLKIYMGNHFELSNCPGNNDTERARYLNFNTTILCNTIVRGERQFEDLLAGGESTAIVVSSKNSDSDDGGYGLDQSVLCPPDCMEECLPDPNNREYCIFDIGQEPTAPPTA